MRLIGRIFSGLCLLLVLIAAWVMLPKPWLGTPPAPPEVQAPLQGKVERILIEKSSRRMSLWQKGKIVREYKIALGFAPEGDKVRQGDGKTPEGIFKIDRRNDKSAFTLSLGLNYPRPQDRARAKAGGYDPGGDIMIHGQPNAMPVGMKAKGDWTAGCIALLNREMREVWEVAGIGTEVEIRP